MATEDTGLYKKKNLIISACLFQRYINLIIESMKCVTLGKELCICLYRRGKIIDSIQTDKNKSDLIEEDPMKTLTTDR